MRTFAESTKEVPAWQMHQHRPSATPTEDIRPSLDGITALSHTATITTTACSTVDLTRASPPLPEGCTSSYLAVFGAFFALFGTFGQMNAFGTFQAWYAQHQLSHLDASTIAWIGSLQLWVFFFSGGLVGKIFDIYGPRWLMARDSTLAADTHIPGTFTLPSNVCVRRICIVLLMASGTILYVFSIMMTSLSTRYYQYLLAQGLLFGLGVGMLFYPALSSVATYFSRYRATALGIAASGSSFGGFAWGVRILVSGLVSACGVLCCIALMTVTRYTPPRSKQFHVDGLPYRRGAAGSALVALGLFIPFIFIVDYAHPIESIPAHTDFLVLEILNAGRVIGRVAPACLSDVIRRFNILGPAAFLCGLLCLVMGLFAGSSLALLLVFAASYGFASGTFISLITPCVAQISEMRQIGCRIGLLYSAISVPAVVGPPIAGFLLHADGGTYKGMILFAGLTVICGSFLLLAARWRINPRLWARV
ncbi:Monocarboxylate permease-like protein [Mycena indigotica]|uniref:Monocarboxylate permease-like protein n=1 Tax=Mycena indigotica TaxID=2126181 RepID=A0A8H6SFR6_9AGAR|nr:Monocarboxylate permease-like protein [Mycena indigotica]KAF7298579.1 Monocarboxylate permease-like protein [Mycena indigotica]